MASSNPDAIESLGDIDGEIYQIIFYFFQISYLHCSYQTIFEKFDRRLLAQNGI